ncbi:hypothetical protein [Streptomyces sp. B6B3]|uniref:hypothetical protein n=1 Tax=Streptomyces sp. B6B3 TaxID=3153570 RepID=UPI00325CF53B
MERHARRHPDAEIGPTSPNPVERLTLALPALRHLEARQSASIDWDKVTGRLGTDLPGDFRAFADRFGAVVIDDFVRLTPPGPEDCEQFLRDVRSGLEILGDWSRRDMSRGYAAYPRAGGLLPWGDSLEGDMFFWDTSPGDPERWPTVIATRSDVWSVFEGGMCDFLTEWLNGDPLEMWGLPPIHPVVEPA